MLSKPVHAEGLDVMEVLDGLIVHQPSRDRVHHLNGTASVVFELCNGEHDEAAIVGVLQRLLRLESPPLEQVRTALDSLRAEQLVI